MKNGPRIIISGGGTGGHIFPALSIADSIKELNPKAEILFVGAEGKMEMEKVPAAGYPIKGLPVAGLQRKLSVKNLVLPFKVAKSLMKAGKIIKDFSPDAAVGVGGYASAPLLWSASSKGIPCLIQEQNSFAGLTNKILGKKVAKICVAYDGMERFFPKEKIIFTGNPVRKEIAAPTGEQRSEGQRFYGLDPQKKTLLVVGGSLGCATLNNTMKQWIEEGAVGEFQVIWQCGRLYGESIRQFLEYRELPHVHCMEFIKRMDLAFAAADVVVSRAGAGTISELCVAGKASILVPSPNVAEDHQTHNALALVDKGAALIVPDADAKYCLMETATELLNDETKISALEKNILPLARKDAGRIIAEEILSMIR